MQNEMEVVCIMSLGPMSCGIFYAGCFFCVHYLLIKIKRHNWIENSHTRALIIFLYRTKIPTFAAAPHRDRIHRIEFGN